MLVFVSPPFSSPPSLIWQTRGLSSLSRKLSRIGRAKGLSRQSREIQFRFVVKSCFSGKSWNKAQSEPVAGGSPRTDGDDSDKKKSRHPIQVKKNCDTKPWIFISFQPARGKTSSTHLFHSEGSSSCRSTFISSNTFWAFTNSSSALVTEKGDCQLQHRQVPCRAGTTVTFLTCLGDQAKFWHEVISIPNESPRNQGCTTDDPSAWMCSSQVLNGSPHLYTQQVIQTTTNVFQVL